MSQVLKHGMILRTDGAASTQLRSKPTDKTSAFNSIFIDNYETVEVIGEAASEAGVQYIQIIIGKKRGWLAAEYYVPGTCVRARRTHTRTHTCMHTYIHAHIHAHMHACARAHTHTHTCIPGTAAEHQPTALPRPARAAHKSSYAESDAEEDDDESAEEESDDDDDE